MATIKPIDKYQDNSDPDIRDGYYYCTVLDGPQYGLLAGPYDTHQEAIDALPEAKKLAQQVDSRAVFYAFGTARLERGDTSIRPAGVLNVEMGLLP